MLDWIGSSSKLNSPLNIVDLSSMSVREAISGALIWSRTDPFHRSCLALGSCNDSELDAASKVGNIVRTL